MNFKSCLIFLLLLSAGPGWGEGKKPPEKKPAEKPSHTLHDVKEGTNDALNNFDHELHEAGSSAKQGANQALEAIDEGVHKAIAPKK